MLVLPGQPGTEITPSLSPLAALTQLKKDLAPLSQAPHCNPAEVAYGSHCLSQCCLSRSPNTLIESRTQIHGHITHTLDLYLTKMS